MILRELFYFSKDTANSEQDDRYIAPNDSSQLDLHDTRKTKLTLKQINQLRRASDAHSKEEQKELEFISRMYATPAQV